MLIGLGANLPSPEFGSPRETLQAALARLDALGVPTLRCSRWYKTRPVPASEQPWYVNAVAAVATDLDPVALLVLLHRVETEFGRVRLARWEARVIDLDLLAYDDLVWPEGGAGRPILPHPRLHQRAFVLRPLADVAPNWRHPASGLSVTALIRALPADQVVELLEAGA